VEDFPRQLRLEVITGWMTDVFCVSCGRLCDCFFVRVLPGANEIGVFSFLDDIDSIRFRCAFFLFLSREGGRIKKCGCVVGFGVSWEK